MHQLSSDSAEILVSKLLILVKVKADCHFRVSSPGDMRTDFRIRYRPLSLRALSIFQAFTPGEIYLALN